MQVSYKGHNFWQRTDNRTTRKIRRELLDKAVLFFAFSASIPLLFFVAAFKIFEIIGLISHANYLKLHTRKSEKLHVKFIQLFLK